MQVYVCACVKHTDRETNTTGERVKEKERLCDRESSEREGRESVCERGREREGGGREILLFSKSTYFTCFLHLLVSLVVNINIFPLSSIDLRASLVTDR